MSVFDFHSRILADYRDFVRSFFTVAHDRAHKFLRRAILVYHGLMYVAERRMEGS